MPRVMRGANATLEEAMADFAIIKGSITTAAASGST